MKRRQFLQVSSVCSGAALASAVFASGASSVAQGQPLNNTLPRFAVISDTHFGGGAGGGIPRNIRVVQNLLRQGKLDAIIIIGDLTNNGQAAQYDQLLKVYKDDKIVPASQRVVFLMGNHEFYNKEGAEKNYAEKIGQPKHQYIDIKGYPFITVSMSGGSVNDYNAEGQQFLKESLADADKKYPDKPIFVFFHIPPAKTSYGSHSWGNTVLPPYLEKYPQVVVFNGHTHTPVGDQRMIFQDKYTAINDGSCFYACIEEKEVSNGISPEGSGDVQDGLIVNVHAGSKLHIERWDLRRNVVYTPWDVDWKKKNYREVSDKESPKFADSAKPKVSVSGSGALVTYPQATDSDIVFRYIIDIKAGDETVASYKQFSQFYLTIQQPEKLTVEFNDLPKGKQLVASVKALDSFGNVSAAVVSEPFTV
ncbi:MAG: metallophosphoesterase [Planctomycetaceae bacterium]|jgi:predicted phosphodiesterase|nr:metallophosphoesterase [Planctomycetaceae bacterium]